MVVKEEKTMATTKQIPFLLGRLVEHQEYFGALSNESAQWAAQHPQEAITLFVQSVENRQQDEQPLLTCVGTVKVQPMRKLVVSKFFNTNNSSVRIHYVGDNFKTCFYGKIEEQPNIGEIALGDGPYRTPGNNGADESALRYHTLNRRSVDGFIIKELGGEDNVKVTLSLVAALMLEQPNGEQGALLTNGYLGILYVHNVAVSVSWNGHSWGLNAYMVGGPGEWSIGYRVFSRDS
ncbi:MAG: hypothetical protein A2469_03120 [Candidatus Magasanikbacteria bacterium RIFOXYC2_FULL_40_16]|uniref:Uncharacterized protein n=3 Tax=Candidatus Magasanikiibacteriota TaxID=1752731 RepID=A0A1F6NH59_9BACT|nr:MAG: hypothetical protein A2373_01465 [Candidatus Magasanikbacteria bacterium RIFOXYB1_FULL_40_15]OGH86909.1 MAG: hypothetical protein A2301_03490 [Candidatus Magasanikbacteria bacterium RIFOXYB2_FULL_40_13]OGH87366.1 MAG: hypothetical protein A2206_03700 [Candidatus Magasanikbacteria bacterium RIFOXYA1_FULL_40_8]OGH89881.1 MAG: hypothetical protein A2469_03120 [Candidatus Magasanikbacteria bacterium RIFOXYC2_FULL_40_16]